MSDNNWHVGQEVVVGHHLDRRVDVIERLTATQAVTRRGSRFLLKNGRSVGVDRWWSWHASDNPNLITQVREKNRREVLCRQIADAIASPHMPLDALERMAEIAEQARAEVDAEKAKGPV